MGTIKIFCLLFSLMFFVDATLAQKKVSPKNKTNKTEQKPLFSIPDDFCISADEMQLVTLINNYRKQHTLSEISTSKSLCFVAKTHVNDLIKTKADLQRCGLYSWSDKGAWTPTCYTKDENGLQNMANKPNELIGYQGIGHEMAYWSNEEATAQDAMDSWLLINLSKNIFLNLGKWREKEWKVIGVCVKGGYAVVWFGNIEDPSGNAEVCGAKPVVLEKTHSPIVDLKPASEPKTKKNQESSISEGHYHLIVGSYKTQAEAQIKLKSVTKQGYTNSSIISYSKGFRVSLSNFATKDVAQKKQQELKAVFPDVWIAVQ